MAWLLVALVVVCMCIYIMYTLRETTGTTGGTLDAFIDTSTDNDGSSNHGNELKDKYKQLYLEPGKQLLILYGTEYGFSEEVARTLFDRLEEYSSINETDMQCRLVNARDYEFIDFDKEHVLLVVISTSGDGVPPTDARSWVDGLKDYNKSLSHLLYSVLALGDSNYPHFCRAGKIVDQRLSCQGAVPLVQRSDVDMEDWSIINDWIQKIIKRLESVTIETRLDYLSPKLPRDNDKPDRNRPVICRMTVKRSLTSMADDGDDDKETIHCEFDLTDSELSYTSGDALGIFPQNNPTEVRYLLDVLRCTGQEPMDVPAWAYLPKPVGQITVEEALMKYFDLKHVKPELLLLLEKVNEDGKTKIAELLKEGTSKKNRVLSKYFEDREVADVITDLGADIAMDWRKVLTNMKGLQPRYYSISSSPYMDGNIACVTAAVVRYKTLGKNRTGVATTYLQDRLHINQSCPVFISQNPDFRLPSNKQLPIIMIGPGTGIAPFRAFIQERVYTNAQGPNILYFGCRHRNKDFLYKNELEDWVDGGHLVLKTAFSREQTYKIYVQDLLRQDSEFVWKKLQDGAYIFVCGDAKHMAQDVHKALIDICQSNSDMNQSEAEKYLILLEENKRYQKDVWVT